jgi:hypothetical protein
LPRQSRTRLSIVRLHELVRLDHLSETFDARGVRPRLYLALLPHDSSKATSPLLPRESLDNTLNRALSNELSVQASVVEDRGEVDDRSESADHSSVAQVLVANDSLADGLSLRDFRVMGFEQVESDVTAGELEGEVGGGVVCGRSADVRRGGVFLGCTSRRESAVPRWRGLRFLLLVFLYCAE